MVTILAFHEDKVRQLSIQDLFRIKDDPVRDEMVIWIDMDNPTELEEETILIHYFLFHHLAIEDCQRERYEPDEGDHFPKVEDYHDYLFIIFNSVGSPVEKSSYLDDDEDEEERLIDVSFPTTQINAFLGKNYIVTHHYEQSKGVDITRQLCFKNPFALRRGPDYIFHQIIDQIVEQYNPVMDYFDLIIDKIELSVFQNPNSSMLSKILSLKKGIQKLRRIMIYQREILLRLSRGDFALISGEEIAYYRNGYDDLVRITDLTENYREMVAGLLEAYVSVSSNRLNEIMKVLTVISSIFLPLTLITGVYGMNFRFMPELQWQYGYFGVLLFIVLTGGAMLAFYKRKGWLD